MSAEKKLTITAVAKQDSRWRCGLQFTKEPRTVEVTEAQKAAIEGDPFLAVVANPDEPKKGK